MKNHFVRYFMQVFFIYWKFSVFIRSSVNFPNEVLLKIFSNLDFQSRIRVESICKSCREIITKNLNKLPPADDTSKNIKLTSQKIFATIKKKLPEDILGENDFCCSLALYLVSRLKMIKTNEHSFGDQRANSFCVEIYKRLKKIVPKVANGIVDVYIDHVEIDKAIIMLLDNFCSRDYRLTLHDAPLNFYQSFVGHYSDRLTITPEPPWAIHFIL